MKLKFVSREYASQLRLMHGGARGFGGGGFKHAPMILKLAEELKAQSILDYGCGEGTLGIALRDGGFAGDIGEYDPGITGKEGLPAPADLVVCTDVMEHVEPEHVDEVLEFIYKLSLKGTFFLISTTPGSKVLPNGKDVHLSVHPPEWWLSLLRWKDFHIVTYLVRGNHQGHIDLSVWTLPRAPETKEERTIRKEKERAEREAQRQAVEAAKRKAALEKQRK